MHFTAETSSNGVTERGFTLDESAASSGRPRPAPTAHR